MDSSSGLLDSIMQNAKTHTQSDESAEIQILCAKPKTFPGSQKIST